MAEETARESIKPVRTPEEIEALHTQAVTVYGRTPSGSPAEAQALAVWETLDWPVDPNAVHPFDHEWEEEEDDSEDEEEEDSDDSEDEDDVDDER